jgi:hypothetical protein
MYTENSSDSRGTILSLNTIEHLHRLELDSFVTDFNRQLLYVLTNGHLLIAFNLKTREIENVLRLKGFKLRMFFLNKSDWIVFVDNRSEITILEYIQKQFHIIMKFDLGLIHLEKVEEILHGKVALLDRGGELGFYDIDQRRKKMEQTNRLKPLLNQSIKDFLYISSVSLTRNHSCSFGVYQATFTDLESF